MNHYRSYQEAKLANPNAEIVTTSKKWDGGKNLIGNFKAKDDTYMIGEKEWEACNPSDYCMSLEDFFNFGYELSIGDTVISLAGSAFAVKSQKDVDIYSERVISDHGRFVLKAKALDQLIETPEEKEALDSIKPIADVAIKKGDACEIHGEPGSFTLVGFAKDGCVVERENGELEVYPKCSLKKKGFKLNAELKERVEAFNDMLDLIRDKSLSHGYIDICAALYDAGYRKVS